MINRIKIILLLLTILLFIIPIEAQVQHGYVKTKGRIDNFGNTIAGKRLPGTTIKVDGRYIVSHESGNFSFPVSKNTFNVLSIRKNNYILYDREQLRGYKYSSNPLIFVLEKPEDHHDDKLIAQQKISRTLRKQLAQRENEIERLKEEGRVSRQEYQRLYNELYNDDRKNQQMVEAMAEKYASLDFDQLDDANRKIKTLILNGELKKADSLINAKGNIEARIASLWTLKEVNQKEERILKERENNLNKSKVIERQTLEDIAEDCLNKHNMYKLRYLLDSASYYIQLRADLDTMNFLWQYDVASFEEQHNTIMSEKMYKRALYIATIKKSENERLYEPYMAYTYTKLADIYRKQVRYSQSIEMLENAVPIFEHYSNLDSTYFINDLIVVYNSLAELWRLSLDYQKSEEMLLKIAPIIDKIPEEKTLNGIPILIQTYINWGLLFKDVKKDKECVSAMKEAIGLIESLMDGNIEKQSQLANCYSILADIYSAIKDMNESEKCRKYAIEIYKSLAAQDPFTYELALSKAYYSLAHLYVFEDVQRTNESEQLYRNSIRILENRAKKGAHINLLGLILLYNELEYLYRNMGNIDGIAKEYSSIISFLGHMSDEYSIEDYKNNLPIYYIKLANLYIEKKQYRDSFIYYELALKIMEPLYEKNPKSCKQEIYELLVNLSYISLLTKQYLKAEKYSLKAIKIDSTNYMAYSNLAPSYLLQGKYNEAEKIYRQYNLVLRDEFLKDFKEFTEADVIPSRIKNDVKKIIYILTRSE